MARTLIVGISNPLRCDDGLGWQVAQELSRELASDGIHVVATQQLTPEISEMASRADLVLFIDAARSGNPGTLRCEQVMPSGSASRLSHDLSPPGVLKLAQELYGHSPAAHLFTLAGESFATGDALSATVAASVPALKAQVCQLIDRRAEEKNGVHDTPAFVL